MATRCPKLDEVRNAVDRTLSMNECMRKRALRDLLMSTFPWPSECSSLVLRRIDDLLIEGFLDFKPGSSSIICRRAAIRTAAKAMDECPDLDQVRRAVPKVLRNNVRIRKTDLRDRVIMHLGAPESCKARVTTHLNELLEEGDLEFWEDMETVVRRP